MEMTAVNNQVVVTEEVKIAPAASLAEANEGFDLGYVFTNNFIKITSKGKFMFGDRDFGDVLDVVVVSGKDRYVLWGADDTDFKGKLLLSADTQEEAAIKYVELCDEIADTHKPEDIRERYMIDLIPVADARQGVMTPLTLDLSYTAKLAFGKYANSVFTGAYNAVGVKAGTGLKKVVTRLTSVEMQNKAKQKYTTVNFTAIGVLY